MIGLAVWEVVLGRDRVCPERGAGAGRGGAARPGDRHRHRHWHRRPAPADGPHQAGNLR